MSPRLGARRSATAAIALAWAAMSFSSASCADTVGAAPFVEENSRIYVALSFLRSDGGRRASLALVDLGAPTMTLSSALLKELALERNAATIFVGGTPMQLDRKQISADAELPYALADGRPVEAVLPAVALQKNQIVIDYAQRTLTVAPPDSLELAGDAVPIELNSRTGLIAVQLGVGGRTYAATIDPGSAYTWLRQTTVREWLLEHPDWERGVGAVGASNMRMADDGVEASGVLLRIPELHIGTLRLRGVRALGVGHSSEIGDFMDWYSKKSPRSVIGWLGGNVLQDFRLTIDYPRRMMYWQRQGESSARELDQVGLTLSRRGAEYFIAAVALREGKPTVEGVRPGDKLLQIDDLRVAGKASSEVLAALHGAPGSMRALVLERGQRRIDVQARVVEF